MSYNGHEIAHGVAAVYMTCAECGRNEWIVARITDAWREPFYVAIEQSPTWQETHDAYVCSDSCARSWWQAEA